jgi:S1-C subfamily serine protease
MFRFLLYTMVACSQPANAHMEIFDKINFELNLDLSPEFNDEYSAELDPYASKGLKDSYLSSVVIEVSKGGRTAGMGSGNYFRMGRDRFIITAAHVVDGTDKIMIIEKGSASTEAKVVYMSVETDIAILVPEKKLRYTKALPFRRDINNQMGEKIYHTGHPAREGWHISAGILSGTHKDVLMLNSFAWPGSSGSVVFDESGRVLGVVSAIRMDAIMGVFPQFIEHIILASNIKTLDQDDLKAALRDEK